MFREESEISILNGMTLCCAPVYINTLGAQPGLCLVLTVQESDSHTHRLIRAWTRAPSSGLRFPETQRACTVYTLLS